MKIRILRDASVEQLRDSVGKNLSYYRYGDFSYLDMDSSQFHELPVDANDAALGARPRFSEEVLDGVDGN